MHFSLIYLYFKGLYIDSFVFIVRHFGLPFEKKCIIRVKAEEKHEIKSRLFLPCNLYILDMLLFHPELHHQAHHIQQIKQIELLNEQTDTFKQRLWSISQQTKNLCLFLCISYNPESTFWYIENTYEVFLICTRSFLMRMYWPTYTKKTVAF